MKKNFKFIPLFLLVLTSSFLSASENPPVQNRDFFKSFEKKEFISTNVNFLKNTVIKKIQKAEAKLEKYRMKLENSKNEAEAQSWLKKINKLEKALSELKEILAGMDFKDIGLLGL